MTGLDEIVGHPHVVLTLRRTLASGRVPQAQLFRGPEGVGKATTARALAAALLCEAPEPTACGTCRACRLVGRNAHPDLLRITREPKRPSRADDDVESLAEEDLSSFVRIDQIRELARLAGRAPREGRRRVFLIDPADCMNLEAQNALLKTLEEPPASTVLLLIASRPHLLLPTVRSRCFTLGFSALDTEELAALLERRGLSADEARVRAALSEGRPGRAVELDLEELRARREELLGFLESLAGDKPRLAELPGMANALAGKSEPTLLAGLELVESLLRDAARLGTGGQGSQRLVHVDLQPRLERLGEQMQPARAAEVISGLERARGYLRVNANRTLVAEAVLASLAGAPLP